MRLLPPKAAATPDGGYVVDSALPVVESALPVDVTVEEVPVDVVTEEE